MDFPNKLGKMLRDPAQDKKRCTHIMLTEKVENMVRISDYPTLHSAPADSPDKLCNRLSMKIVFDIN
jgi:hypothetical protein